MSRAEISPSPQGAGQESPDVLRDTLEPRREKDRGFSDRVKRCRKCLQVKPVERFPTNRRVSDGRSSWCRDCHNAATRAWRRRTTNEEASNG